MNIEHNDNLYLQYYLPLYNNIHPHEYIPKSHL
nr:MAG TPA: hypothetical protein [Bacteriophage sp.]